MTRIKVLLGTTALIGAGMLVGVEAPAHAATVSPGGALDININGFARFRAHGGDLDNARLNDTTSSGLDFSNDTEVHVDAKAKDDATGLEYGGSVEFEADTNQSLNTDETWLFVRGGFGEFRFGDEDGPIDNSTVFAGTIGAGTGGIDGSVIDVIGTGVAKPFNSGDSTKVRYYTPVIGGFQLGVSYTPNAQQTNNGSLDSAASFGDNVAGKNVQIQQFVEGALTYAGSFGGVNILASGVGGYCQNKDSNDNDDCYSYGGGATLGLFGFKLAGGYFGQKVGVQKKNFYNVGVATGLGPVNLSVTYGQVTESNRLIVNGNELDHPYNLVFSADIGLMPGLVLAGDLGIFNNDVNGSTPGTNVSDNGWQGVVRIGLDF
jgi:hypothetical protein